jgi:hypothetical protein
VAHQSDPSAATANDSGRPSISLVLTGRNDDYGAGFRARFFRTLRFNHRELSARGITYELVFVEWAPPEDRPLLADLVFDEVPGLDPAVCRWIVVDPEYQQQLSLNARLVYLEFLAKNVGVRRAVGQFVLTSNCDVFLGRTVLDTLARGGLRHGVVYRAPRYDLKESMGSEEVGWTELEDPANLEGAPRVLKPPYMGGGTGDFVLLDRATFHELRGFNEIYRVARIGVDKNFVVKALSAGVAVEDIGGPVYHVNHSGSYRLTVGEYAGREAEAPWGDRRWHSGGVVYVNPPSWGLALAPVRRVSDSLCRLDFSWSAVPPLVDLRGVVLPAARLGGPAPGRYVSRS